MTWGEAQVKGRVVGQVSGWQVCSNKQDVVVVHSLLTAGSWLWLLLALASAFLCPVVVFTFVLDAAKSSAVHDRTLFPLQATKGSTLFSRVRASFFV